MFYTANFQLEGDVANVTGAGRAIARLNSAAGAALVSDRALVTVEAVAAGISAPNLW